MKVGKWTEVSSRERNLWVPGVFAIHDRLTGRSYFVAARSLGKRLRDQADLLKRGKHPCRELQEQVAARRADFAFYLVQRTKVLWLLPHFKQMLIDAARRENKCFNQKNAVPRRTSPSTSDE